MMDPISGVRTLGRYDRDAIGGRSYVLHDLGRFELTSTTAVGYKRFSPGYNGRLLGYYTVVETVTADTNADATLIARKNGTNMTGALITLADVNDGTNPVDAVGKVRQSTLITALNTFDENDYLDILWTVTNAFADGAVSIVLVCEYT